jgi:hypothetical protein
MSVYINGRPIDQLVYQVCELNGHLAPSVPQRAPVPLGNAPGVYGTEVTVAPREVTIGLDVRPSSLADRQTIMDTLKRRLSGLLELVTLDLPTRVLRCELQAVVPDFYTGAYAQPAVYVTLRLLAVDPARWDVQPLTYGLSTARTPCPVGTETSAPDLEIYGACVNPSVVLRSHTGREVSRLDLTASLASNDTLLIAVGTQTIERRVAGVIQTGVLSGALALSGGRFPVLSPEDASPLGDAWPTLELVAASGTPTGLVTYTRRW